MRKDVDGRSRRFLFRIYRFQLVSRPLKPCAPAPIDTTTPITVLENPAADLAAFFVVTPPKSKPPPERALGKIVQIRNDKQVVVSDLSHLSCLHEPFACAASPETS
jgi:hypothetical protein